MHAQPVIVGKLQEHLLAVRFRGQQHAAVQQGCAVLEATLRRACIHLLAGELRLEGLRQAVDRVAFWHFKKTRPSFLKRRNNKL